MLAREQRQGVPCWLVGLARAGVRAVRILGRATAVAVLVVLSTLAWSTPIWADESPAALLSWAPPQTDGPPWVMTGERLVEEPPREMCADMSTRVWERPERGYVALLWNACSDSQLAAQLFGFRSTHTPAAEAVGGGALNGGHDRVRIVFNGEGVMRYWAEGAVHVSLTMGCAGPVDEFCRQESAVLARSLSDILPGAPSAGRPWSAQSHVGPLLGGPPAVWLTLFGLPRLLSRLREPKYASRSAPSYEDLTADIGRLRRRRVLRRAGLVLGLLGGLLAVAWLSSDSPALSSFWLALAAVAVAVRVKSSHPLLGRPGFWSPVGRGRRAAAAMFGAVSVTLTLLVCAMWVPFSIAAEFASVVPEWGSYLDPAVEQSPLALPFLVLVQMTRGSGELFFILVIIPVILMAFLAHRFSQRFASLSAAEVVAKDPRPFFLYLRSFDEDQLKTKVSLGRNGLLAMLAPVRRRRFEEVLVRALSSFGPVVAISPPGQRLPALGAARASVDHEKWQDQVVEWASQARAVVLSGTPTEVRQGFGWEIEMLAQSIHHRRVIVIFAPWRPAELRRRLTGFLEHARRWPLFAQLPWIAQDGAHVATFADGRGWRMYGAPRRSDWSYTVCIDKAMTDVLPAWGPPPLSSPPQLSRPGVGAAGSVA